MTESTWTPTEQDDITSLERVRRVITEGLAAAAQDPELAPAVTDAVLEAVRAYGDDLAATLAAAPVTGDVGSAVVSAALQAAAQLGGDEDATLAAAGRFVPWLLVEARRPAAEHTARGIDI